MKQVKLSKIVLKGGINLVVLALKIYSICPKWKSINPQVLEIKSIEIAKSLRKQTRYREIWENRKNKIMSNLFNPKANSQIIKVTIKKLMIIH